VTDERVMFALRCVTNRRELFLMICRKA
jgi:hypothetical protein